MKPVPAWVTDERDQAAHNRAVFAADFGVVEYHWSGYNISRLLRATGERPERVVEMRSILGSLGLGPSRHWPVPGGVFDHGCLFGRDRMPLMLVGHPYQIDSDERLMLRELARYGTLRVSLDDRQSFYGFNSHHVRVELVEVRRPFAKPPATAITRAASRAFALALGTSS